MDARASSDISLFGEFRLDRRRGVLARKNQDGAFAETALGSRAVEILGVLVGRPGDLVSRAEIIEAVWPGTAVEDSNLNVQVAALRRVVDDGRSAGSCIQTVPGRGYRFVAPVSFADPAVPSATAAPAAPRLSIVVLPFKNLSNDPEQQYFADAITEDVTTDLSRLAGSFVISCNTAFTYSGRPVAARQVGRELGVRYVLEGSVQRSSTQIRVNAQLIDAETDAHLWAERFDRNADDLFALQDEITRRIAVSLDRELVAAEASREATDFAPLDYIFRGRAVHLKQRSRDNYAQEIDMFERALALDPNSVAAQSYLAMALSGRVLDNLSDTKAADVERAERLAWLALSASRGSPLAHYARGHVLRAQGRFAEAIPEYETVLAADRNWLGALHALGQIKLLTGSMEEVIPLMQQALRLSPRDPAIGGFYFQIGRVHLAQSQIDEAILSLEKACNASPAHPAVRSWLASAYAIKGRSERAAAELAEARRLSPDAFSSLARLQAVTSLNYMAPKVRALFETTYFAGLRKAGMPEN